MQSYRIRTQGLVKILKFKFSRNADIWSRFWRCCLAEIMKMKYDQFFLRTRDMTLKSYFGNQNSTLGSVVPLTTLKILTTLKTLQSFDSDPNHVRALLTFILIHIGTFGPHFFPYTSEIVLINSSLKTSNEKF